MTTLSGVIEAFLLSLLGATPDKTPRETAQETIRDYLHTVSEYKTSWTNLTKEDWCARVEELLGDPKKIDQGGAPYCMPAACLFVLFMRKPTFMADFCVSLAKKGE